MLYNCQQCGRPFEAAPAAKRKFCSRACMGKAKNQRVERTCKACGKSFRVKLHKVKEGKGKYCSRACADTGWDEPCANCGKPVHRTPFHGGRFENVFCSRKCYAEWKSDQVERTCQQCGKVFTIKPSEVADGQGKYCSLDCYNSARAQEFATLVCQQCGQEYSRPAAAVNPNMYQGKYCSSRCMGVARRLPDSVRSEYNHEFTPRLRREIRKRDGHRCYQCGRARHENGRALDCHHIDYDKTNNHPSNLITLCHSCHSVTNYNRDIWKRYFQEVARYRF